MTNTEEITPEDWEWTINAARRWQRKTNSAGTILNDEIESAAFLGLVIALNSWDKNFMSWQAFLNCKIQKQISDAIRSWFHLRRTNRQKRNRGYNNPFLWPKGMLMKDQATGEEQLESWKEEEPEEDQEQIQGMIVGLEELNPIDKEVIHRYYWGNEQQKEIADSLGVSKMRVSQRMHRGINQLKEILQGVN